MVGVIPSPVYHILGLLLTVTGTLCREFTLGHESTLNVLAPATTEDYELFIPDPEQSAPVAGHVTLLRYYNNLSESRFKLVTLRRTDTGSNPDSASFQVINLSGMILGPKQPEQVTETLEDLKVDRGDVIGFLAMRGNPLTFDIKDGNCVTSKKILTTKMMEGEARDFTACDMFTFRRTNQILPCRQYSYSVTVEELADNEPNWSPKCDENPGAGGGKYEVNWMAVYICVPMMVVILLVVVLIVYVSKRESRGRRPSVSHEMPSKQTEQEDIETGSEYAGEDDHPKKSTSGPEDDHVEKTTTVLPPIHTEENESTEQDLPRHTRRVRHRHLPALSGRANRRLPPLQKNDQETQPSDGERVPDPVVEEQDLPPVKEPAYQDNRSAVGDDGLPDVDPVRPSSASNQGRRSSRPMSAAGQRDKHLSAAPAQDQNHLSVVQPDHMPDDNTSCNQFDMYGQSSLLDTAMYNY